MMQPYAEQLKTYWNTVADVYDTSYTGVGRYRSNYFRLRILVALLQRLADKPANILDAGCGDARPMLELLRQGFDVRGFDVSEAMREAGQQILREAGQDPSRVSEGDIYAIAADDCSYDAVISVGVVETLPDHATIFGEFRRVVRPGGRLFVSLENDLFSLFSMNRHSLAYYRRLFDDIALPGDVREKVLADLAGWYKLESIQHVKKSIEDANIDTSQIQLASYNPLNVSQKLGGMGFDVEEIRFFHYHPLPPRFEAEFPDVFRGLAESLETIEYDWRGGVLCNCMLIQARARR